MTVFTCDDSFESMMSCIYDAWASRLGHKNIRLELEPFCQAELFCDYIHVAPDQEKTERVVRSICQKISREAYEQVYMAAMADAPDRLDAVYRFLLYGFSYGRSVTDILSLPPVMRLKELSRKSWNEAHYFREFTRFLCVEPKAVCRDSSFPQGCRQDMAPAAAQASSASRDADLAGLSSAPVYIAHIEPKCNVLAVSARHFADRMPSEHWMIIDDNRRLAAVHPKDHPFFLTCLLAEEMAQFLRLEQTQDLYTGLWQEFFQAIGIEERKNPRCQRNLLPLWYRKHMPEFVTVQENPNGYGIRQSNTPQQTAGHQTCSPTELQGIWSPLRFGRC